MSLRGFSFFFVFSVSRFRFATNLVLLYAVYPFVRREAAVAIALAGFRLYQPPSALTTLHRSLADGEGPSPQTQSPFSTLGALQRGPWGLAEPPP